MEKELYEVLVSKSNVGIIVLHDWIPSYCNSAFAKIFGYDVSEILEKDNIRDLFIDDDIEQIEAYSKAYQKGVKVPLNCEVKGIKKAGDFVYLNCTMTFCKESGSLALHLTNITESKLIQSRLEYEILQKTSQIHHEKEMMKHISNSINVGIWRIDNDDNLLFANKEFLEIFGRQWDDLKNNQYKEFVSKPPVNIMTYYATSYEVTVTRPSGEVRYVRVHCKKISDVEMVGTMFDITKEKLIIPELLKIKEDLARERECSVLQ